MEEKVLNQTKTGFGEIKFSLV